MSDLISRQAAINAMESINDGICEQQAIDALCELPSEQPEIIRCKDCKYWRPDTRPEDSLEDRTDGLWGWGNLCAKHLPADECEAIEFGPEEFCNFGERKEQEHE